MPSKSFRWLWVRVSDAAGRVGQECTFLPSAVNADDSTLRFGLPEGEWKFEIALDENKSSSTSDPLQISAGGKTEATLVFRP